MTCHAVSFCADYPILYIEQRASGGYSATWYCCITIGRGLSITVTVSSFAPRDDNKQEKIISLSLTVALSQPVAVCHKKYIVNRCLTDTIILFCQRARDYSSIPSCTLCMNEIQI